MIIDTHCHYNLEPLLENWNVHWQKAQANGVTHTLLIGVDLETSRQAIELAASEPAFKVAVGLHPSTVQSFLENAPLETFEASISKVSQEVTQLKELLSDTSVIAIGETGLDYFRLPVDAALQNHIKKLQHLAFIQQIQLANEYDLVLVVHVRDLTVSEQETRGNAYWDTLTLLRQYHEGKKPFILHCASGPISYIKQAVDLGAYFGIAGNVTYKNADHIRSISRVVPPDRLLSETDAPYLPPQEFRGQVCEPWMISKTVEFLKEELGIQPQTLRENAKNLLGFR